ncbi:hypothetical protein ACMD2_11178 [Ananas comosus]|uniref:Uncharacterized protein n=1 Tax=Ananas comosus TaxID=4615 RepID=A0A199USM8_ANACO|nr:hypothetical protein ACMD2_11178 [Ananas comosus]
MSISTLAAEALTVAPVKNRAPPRSMIVWRPTAFVRRPAASDAASPATYSDDVNAVSAWLSYMQYSSSCLASAIFFKTLGKKDLRNDSMVVTPPIKSDPDVVAKNKAAGGRHDAGDDNRGRGEFSSKSATCHIFCTAAP